MSKQVSIRFAVITGVLLALALMSFAAPMNWTAANKDEGMLRPSLTRGSGSLDDDYTQFRYLKTTDYGHTWTELTQAGDFSSYNDSLTARPPDFSGILTTTNEVVFACVAHPDTLSAIVPGVYVLAGPNFTPVLAIPEGTNSFSANNNGWTDMCRTPNGDLIVITWGYDATEATTVWAAKSTNNGATWGTPWVVLTEPTLDPDASFFHLADLTSTTYAFMQFQLGGYEQYVCRFPIAGGVGTITNLNGTAGSEVSYYAGNCKPIAYDPTNDALYACFRAEDLSGTSVYYSGDEAATFSAALVSGAQRYPSVALNAAAQTPWIISNYGAVANEDGNHCAWYSFDEFGYNGGSWTDITDFACIPFDGGDYFLLYMNQAYWWDADRGVASLNVWGDFTPDRIDASYTSDGGTTWTDHVQLYQYVADEINASSAHNCELLGGSNGVAYIITCGQTGITDLEEPVVTEQTLDPSTPATTMGPWVISAFITDNVTVDAPDWCQIEYMFFPVDSGTFDGPVPGAAEFYGADSCQGCDENNNGRWFFTLPAVHHDSSAVAQGDTIWFNIHATDPSSNSGYGPEQAIVVGVAYLGIDEPGNAAHATDLRLLGNYPNPFNPSTRIQFTVPSLMTIDLKVYNTLGQEVAVLADNLRIDAGLYAYTFDASNLPSGVYMYRLSSGSFSDSKKMILVK